MGADYAHVRGECPGGFHLMRVKVDTMYQLTAKRVFLCVIPAFLPPLLLSLAPPLVLLCRQTMRVLNVNKTSRPTTATLATVTKRLKLSSAFA